MVHCDITFLTHPVNVPCGRELEHPATFGRALCQTPFMHTSPYSESRTHNLRLALTTAPAKGPPYMGMRIG